MLYVEGSKPKTVLTQGVEDVISIISNLLSPCLQCESSYPQQPSSLLIMWPLSQILLFQNIKGLLLQNKKLMWAWEEKVQILEAICTSVLTIAEKATLLWAPMG